MTASLPDEIDEDEIDINLLPSDAVGRRMVLLGTLCRRAFLESRAASRELDEDPEVERFDLRTWLQDHELDGELTADEDHLLDADVGTLSANDAAMLSWNAEALVTLGWATEMVQDLPEPYQPSDPAAILTMVPAPWDNPAVWISAVMLRPEDEIARERERTEIWLWRAEIEAERRRLKGRDRQVLESDIADVVREAAAAGLLAPANASDFRVGGAPVSNLSPEAIDAIVEVAAVRLHALNWLCGFGSAWDDVPVDID